MTYFEGIPNPRVRATPHTNGVNSGSGYFDVNWNSVEGAGGYYLGIWDGKEYEYLNVGNTTSFTTRGRTIWPTTGEINAGACKLHLGGGGVELPMIPAHLYAKNNPGSSYANDLNYYFKVVPHNGTGQAPNPALFSEASGVLPDTVAPNKPSAVTVNPSGYTNAANITVSWSGITDYNNTSGGAQTTLSGGQIEYLIDGDSPAGAWKTTGKNTA
ncbi:hypothetical protein [Christensenella hongkongensis]|uniref:Wall-associated protein n=1 Tax=Christensenella hongkongensis TaxID=270498 RepID=A0A0M2NJ17_9FIRM|nr:hypothetical protein [Christensenella hongkongensis]KKI50432.1 Wall-associated protein precursor [Christensenella hongkongensis]KUJ24704.1 hypothetical protein AR437_13030 [Christensenella hongkongensis]